MSLFGAVGVIRSDPGIEELLQLVYATNSSGQRLTESTTIRRLPESTTIMGSVYGICEGDKNVYLC